tara:strand:- start:88 stop:249 length:162 start_codon:yes stop_codon:yes gene_type:complete
MTGSSIEKVEEGGISELPGALSDYKKSKSEGQDIRSIMAATKQTEGQESWVSI